MPLFERVHQTASQNPATAYPSGRNIHGSLSASANHCSALSCVPATTSWQSRGSLLLRLPCAQVRPRPGWDMARLCSSWQEARSVQTGPLLPGHPVSAPQARVRRETQLSQEPTGVFSTLPNSDSDLSRERLELSHCSEALLGVKNLSFHPSTSHSRSLWEDDKAKRNLRFFICLYPEPSHALP